MAMLSAEDDRPQVLWEDEERALCRGRRADFEGRLRDVLMVRLTAERPARASIDRLAHEFGLKDNLDSAWAARPLELVLDRDPPMLVLEDPGGQPLAALLGKPMGVASFLRLALASAGALGKLHQSGLVHKDLKPAHILVNHASGSAWLTGLGLASRLPSERQAPTPPEFIAGTLAYMAPEQTGRMNRSIDSRSDLYSLGVTFYQMLTGALPFTASDPMEWVHCHIARTPVAPAEGLASIPAPVSSIAMKLLAKTAEERYQTAAGVEHDLRRCLAEWETRGRIADFTLGANDLPDRLMIPEKLYGRTREVGALLDAFDAVVARGLPQLVLVSGYSGIGKSSVVNELHKAMVPPRGLFASGKFEQYKRDIPYATLAQAFQGLVDQLLSKSEAELQGWRDALREALGPSGQMMVDLIPQLELVIGRQPAITRLSPQDAQRRFQIVFRRFLDVFASAEHPLSLFLDDLQWLDAATLELLEELLSQRDLRHLLLVGAFRDNEVSPTHPLVPKLEAIRRSGATVREIVLAPLTHADLGQLIAESLGCGAAHAVPLAQLVHEKTGGNPLFVIQFLHALAEEALISFDHGDARWYWNLLRIHAKPNMDNVVDLMGVKLNRLPARALGVLQQLACIGQHAPFKLLATVCETPAEQVHADLWDAVRSGLVLRSDGGYSFHHDRVQEAAYSMIPAEDRPQHHLRIGRLLAANTAPAERGDFIFEIVNQFNRSTHLLPSREERELVAELNLAAAERAKSSTAYASASRYLAAGAALLEPDCWDRRHALVFRLELQRAECEFLTDELAQAEQRLAGLSGRAGDTVERSRVACLQIDMYTTLDQGERAIAAGLAFLRQLGMDWPEHPTDEEVRDEYDRTRAQLDQYSSDELLELPLMTDAAAIAILDVLSKLAPPAFFNKVGIFVVLACRTVRLILESGNSDASPAAYVRLGIVAARLFGDYQGAYRLGQLGRDLVDQRGLARFRAVVYFLFGNMVMPWRQHFKTGRELARIAFKDARDTGYLYYATVCAKGMDSNQFAAGDPLAVLQRDAEEGVAFGRSVKYESVTDLLRATVALARMLRGLTPRFGSLDDADFDEGQIERRYAGKSGMVQFVYWTAKLKARLFAGDCAAAVEVASRLQVLLPENLTTAEPVEYRFYGALALAAACDGASAGQRALHLAAVAVHHGQLQEWAAHCPDNFEGCAALVGAEIARLSGQELEAMRLYERAIRSARANGFTHIEALAHELAAGFHAALGFKDSAEMHLLKARNGYLRWGADGKVRQLEALHPHLGSELARSPQAGMIGAPVDNLDLATVVNVSRAVSSEIVLDKLLGTLVRTAIQQAGAQRGLLVVPGDGVPRVEAEAVVNGNAVKVELRDAPVTETTLPKSVLLYVLRTLEPLILDDAVSQQPFGADPYVRQHKARSIFCLPLLTQAKLSGVLYLENNLAPRVFMPGRTGVLKMLASQAAIALENARLYRDVAEREARFRRLVDANIIGTYIWKVAASGGASDPVLVEANDAFLRMVGYGRADLAAHRVTRNTLSPPDWRERDALTMAHMQAGGSVAPFEREYLRKDGTRVPVLMGLAAFDDRRLEGLAFVIDLTERKQAEAEAREKERSYLEVQAALEHASRVATLGQLTATIAHEVSQPVSGVLTNASTALRWLGAETPNLADVTRVLNRIVRDGTRAREVIERIRAIVRKAPPRKDRVEIGGAIREVIELTKGEAVKSGILVHTALADDLPAVEGDRVQLQQVMLNLIVNAIDAINDAGESPRELWISAARSEPDSVLVMVRDSGSALEPLALARVFDPFFTTKPQGLGMGLSICRSIVEAHGGKLSASAGAPRGAVFQFTLPATAAGIALDMVNADWADPGGR
ncbi:MAG: protein kinase [Ramlibacter sp.]|nr:protein kinase [Ramlibacter sp.]